MDLYGKLQLRWSLGYKGSQLHFISNTTLVYGCGNTLTFMLSDGTHVRSLPSEGRGVGPIAVCPKMGLVAYAESTLQPKLFMLKYPDCSLVSTLKGKAQLEYTCLAFTADGKKLATLSGVPDFMLTIWDCQTGVEMCEVAAGPGGSQVSFNPLNWKQLCLVGPSRVVLWTLEQCDMQQLLSPIEVEVPDKATPVGTLVQPMKPPPTLSTKTSTLERAETKSDRHMVTALSSPPNLSHVLYKESYNTFMKKKNPVVFTSHCWTPHQSIYVGCEGGQILLADSETGTIKVVTNPWVAQGRSFQSLATHPGSPGLGDDQQVKTERSGSGGEEGELPRTGHAVLGEGLVNCLALSRRGVFTAGRSGVICCFEQTSELPLVDSCTLPHPITCLVWSTNYDKVAIGTQQGSIFMADPLNLRSITLVSDHRNSQIMGIDVLTPGFNHCVSCRSDGYVQVWDFEKAAHVSSFNLETECCSVACPLSSHAAVVGTRSGHLCAISLTNLASPRMVVRRKVYHTSVKTIRHDHSGKFMATISSEGPVYFYDTRPSSRFAVIGYTVTQGEVLDLSLLPLGQGKEGWTQAAVLTLHKGKTVVTLMQLPNSIQFEDVPPELYTDATKQFSSDFILRQEAVITKPVATFTLAPNNCAFAVLVSTSQLAKFNLPPADEKDVDWELSPNACYPGHELVGGEATLSFHQKWMTSGAPDGKLLVRLVENPERTVSCTPHHYQERGCSNVVFSTNSQYLLTTGDSGTLTCWEWQFTRHGSTKGSTALEYAQRYMRSLEALHNKENATLDGMSAAECSWGKEEDSEKTWLELAEEEAHKAEDEKYAEIKAQLRQEISELREKVLAMIAANEQLPDIERLERHHFILDTEEYQRLQAEEDQLIEKVQEELELSNLAKMFLRERIKEECWSNMTVKGKVVKSFQSRLEVSNYPLKDRSAAKLQELERVKTLRRIEIAEKVVHKDVDATLKQTLQSYRAEEDEEDLLGEGREQASQEEGPGDPDALRGSHGAQYGGESELLYSQFELHSPITKKNQIQLLEDCVHCIKESFNKEFEEVFRLKKAEIARIQEKNVRISKIISQLKLEEAIVQPSLNADEEPERLLTVEDDEITVEKYISPEERSRMEEAEKQEEQRRLAEMGDNPRERALDMMMGGRLEANVEEDLFKDFARPEFMQKDASEMSEEELRQAREIERKEKEFLEEREKLKRALEAELRKLQGSIVQAMEQFDERLGKLFQLKIRTEMAVHQEELQILHLSCSLLVEEEVGKREQQLHRLLEEKKNAKVQLGGLLNMAKRQVEEQREQYEQMVAEDREVDRSFRRDFADCEPHVDQLYKLFRKRPRGQRLKLGPSEGGLVPDPTSHNPFAQRPSSAVAGGRGENPMAELDHISHKPEDLETSAWERFVIARRRKVENEHKVKAMALKLAEMNAFLQRRQAKDEHLQQEIQDTFKEINKLQEDKSVVDLNLEVQFLLKQGQVEVDLGDFVPDFSDSVLIHRSAIEELNSQIETLGEAKLSSMTECVDFKKGIHMLEWELKKLHMEAEDLTEKARDIQMLRVTKELQQRLMEENVASKDQHEIETLEKTIELNQKMHKKNVQARQRDLSKLRRQVEERRQENRELDHQLMEQQVAVLEREAVENLAGVLPSEANREQRMHDIVMRRRLVELVKSQAQEISVLQSEVERQRMRTFPALVQVD